MKYAIDLGHGVGRDRGASGIRDEEDLINETGALVIQKLKLLGHEVIEVRPKNCAGITNSLQQRCDAADDAKANIYVSLHFNAANGRANGTEVFAMSLPGRRLAQKIVNEISALGFINRGVKDGSHLYVVRSTSMPAVLVEGCFIDSMRDIALYEAEHMANAIVLGLCGKTPNIADKAA
ncbi:MAG: N-acetylmuramoyl-L-alanine amidase [Calothrix sp. FI2-JRJ7]|jgi:N-acetylmuramoyl-L-alanine amidase|nr:N-acetylmuramoyl-L-alanine amidase [Calothrix sp. FI2-JRJ7]MBW4598748.1 N-acetylmuramoyl-L-alanine amidase [Calothrix sp. FI2-JRJ7]